MTNPIETLQGSVEELTIPQPSSVAANRNRERAMPISLCSHHMEGGHFQDNAYNIAQSINNLSLANPPPTKEPTPVFFIFHGVDKHRVSTFDYEARVWRLHRPIRKVPPQFCRTVGQLFAHAIGGYMFATHQDTARVVYATSPGYFQDVMVVEGDEEVFESLMEMVERGKEWHTNADGECVVEFRVYELEIDGVIEEMTEG